MGLRFQRRIKVLPGVRINLSKSGVGLSVGGRGAHIGITARGQRYTSIGLPGTGLSWREYQRKPEDRSRAGPISAPRQCELCAPGHLHLPLVAVVFFIVCAVAVLALVLLSGR